jgi:hydrogenase maturation protease
MTDITVLGIGNILLQDEGFGVTVIESLQRDYDFPEAVQVIDGGTLGTELTYFIEGTKKLIVVDAINSGKEPGTFCHFEGADVRNYFQEKVSMHELGIQDVLAALEVSGKGVGEVVVLGCEPYSLEAGIGLTEKMGDWVEPIKKIVLEKLASWQVVPKRREQG